MKTRLHTKIFLAAVLCTVLVGAALAKNNAPGVSVGNEFVYSLQSRWASNDSNVRMPNGLAEITLLSNTMSSLLRFRAPNVSTHNQWHYANGTSVNSTGSVSTETGTYQGGFWTIIAGNLNAKDRVHPNLDQDQSTINETVMRDYGGYNRDINHLDLEFLNERSDIPGATYSEHVNTFFDRQTGTLVQLEDTHPHHNPDIAFAVTWKLVSQNAWTGSEENKALSLHMIILVVAVAFVVVTLLIVLAHRKKQRNRKK